MVNLFIILTSLFFSGNSYAASCCGASASGINIITNDAVLKLGTTYSNKIYLSDIDSSGKASKRTENEVEIREVLNLSAARMLGSFSQYSIEAGVVKITKNTSTLKSSENSVADLKVSFAYEFLPEEFYHPIKPRGFVFISLDIPTGRSKYDFEKKTGVDITSSGLYQLSLGGIFLKVIRDFEIKMNGAFIKPLNNDFDNGTYVKKSLGYSSALDISYGAIGQNITLGIGVGVQILGKERVDSNGSISQTSIQREYPLNLSSSYMYSDELSFSLNYIDTKLLGGLKNTSSYQQVSLAHNWLGF